MRSETHSEAASENDAADHRGIRPVELHRVLSCPVCYDEHGSSSRVVFVCGHVLCVRCLKRWSKNCPTCRCDDHVEFVDEKFVDRYDENISKLRALSDSKYECRIGVFAYASPNGMTVMQNARVRLKKI